MEEYIGIIKIFAGTFAPRGWALCDGQLMNISQNTALFSIIGTTYGGNGVINFGLPDLRGKVPIGVGQGPGLTNQVPGQVSGTETTSLAILNLPPHQHNPVTTLKVSDAAGTLKTPVAGSVLAQGIDINTDAAKLYAPGPGTVALGSIQTTEQPIGGGVAFSNLQPSLGVNYIICLFGVFPSRN